MDSTESKQIRPGINPNARIDHFSYIEKTIIERLGTEWYITNGGSEILLGSSTYRYVLLKPINSFQEQFNIDREIIAIFSQYTDFEPRTLDAISEAYNRHQALRLERICSIVISGDDHIETKLRDLLKNDQEAQIVIPFTYNELQGKIKDSFFFRNRFKIHFYSRDLFASESPLKKDIYFFGRTDIVHSLINRHRSNQVSGLFGLRKTGKTSVIFGVQRALIQINGISTFIDCQSPAFHKLRWPHALHYVLNEIKTQNALSFSIGPIDNYTEERSASLFEKYLTRAYSELGNRSIMLIFDEIENITPTASPSAHWRSGIDFVFFWQTLRSLFQKKDSVFSYLIVGTNPLCVELSKIGSVDNPIFAQVPLEYIPGFDVQQTREMVRRLGRIMGLHFDEIIYSKLTDDFGGHPYLIRHLCSVINNSCKRDRPIRVDKTLYDQSLRVFIRDYSQFIEMILNILKEFFPDELEMLKMLARGDVASFSEFARSSPLFTNHLIGYGILQEVDSRYSFKVELIKIYLENLEKYKKLNLSVEEMRNEISERRNKIELQLRKLCKMQLLAQLGKTAAHSALLTIFGDKRSSELKSLDYSSLFDANKTEIYLMDILKIITKHWDCFKNVFSSNKDDWINSLRTINEFRIDAHAKSISDSEFHLFRVCAEKYESCLASFLE